MKKIGIITIIDYQNYGNRLQNFALQEYLKKYNFDVVTIKNSSFSKKSLIKRLNNLMKYNFKEIVILIFNKLKNLFFKTNENSYYNELRSKRYSIFKDFTEKNIVETDYEISPNNFPEKINEMFDFFIVGSDQVWNYNFRECSPIDFLTFADKKKRIAFSASFGVNSIPSEYIERYKKWLLEFKNISVREQSGANLIKKIINRDVEVLLDPTLLIDIEIWKRISFSSNNKPKGKFILTYFLGEKDIDYSSWVANLNKKQKLEIVNISDMSRPDYYCTGPSEFLDYIRTCELFLTDSFHGVVFSIIFKKPFIVFERRDGAPSMMSRIDTLLEKFNFQDRIFNPCMSLNDVMRIDFNNVENIIENERALALQFLCRSIGDNTESHEN